MEFSQVLSCTWIDWEEVKGSDRKKELGKNPGSLCKQAYAVKDSLYVHKECIFPVEEMGKILSSYDCPIFPAQVANENTGSASSCPLAD